MPVKEAAKDVFEEVLVLNLCPEDIMDWLNFTFAIIDTPHAIAHTLIMTQEKDADMALSQNYQLEFGQNHALMAWVAYHLTVLKFTVPKERPHLLVLDATTTGSSQWPMTPAPVLALRPR